MNGTRSRHSVVLDVLTVGLLVMTFAATFAVYDRLPSPIPTHFDLRGHPNGWMPREVGGWILPALTVALVALVRFGGLLLPPGWRDRFEASPVQALAFAMAAWMSGLQIALLRAALSAAPRLGGVVWVLVGALFMALGLLLPRTRRNPLFGVRTPFALASDENWARTQRVAGYSITCGGLGALVAGLLDQHAFAVASILVSALVPALWSWLLARRGTGDIPRMSR